MEKRVHSPSSPTTRLAKQNLEILRTSLIERAWQSGVQGRKRLEAGFTLDVCRKIAHIKKVNGEDDYDAAYSLVLWVVQVSAQVKMRAKRDWEREQQLLLNLGETVRRTILLINLSLIRDCE